MTRSLAMVLGGEKLGMSDHDAVDAGNKASLEKPSLMLQLCVDYVRYTTR